MKTPVFGLGMSVQNTLTASMVKTYNTKSEIHTLQSETGRVAFFVVQYSVQLVVSAGLVFYQNLHMYILTINKY